MKKVLLAVLGSVAEELEIDPNEYEDWGTLVNEILEGEETEEEEVEEEEVEEDEEADETDWVVLATDADGGDEDAVVELEALAQEHEVDSNDYATYADMIEALVPFEADDEEEEEEEDEVDYDALAAAADEGDEEAVATLEAYASESSADADEYATYVELVAALAKGEEEESDDDWMPEKGEVYNYKPSRKPLVPCEVTRVVKKHQTVNLKALDEEGKVYKTIGWDKLQGE